MERIRFTKAVATGNDFVIIDNRGSGSRRSGLPALARQVCDRKRSIGADGLLVICESANADFRMRVFNPDGSEAEMCGNGSRCAALYAKVSGIAGTKMRIETLAGTLDAGVKDDTVKVLLPDPKDIKWNLCLMIHECPYKVSFVNSSVPHVIHFVDDLEKLDVKGLGSHMRYHEEFSPHGANVDFVKVLGTAAIGIRTYERGVEDETLACGTGAVASAVIAAESEKMASPVTVETRGAEKLKVYFKVVKGHFRDVYLEGAARLVFEGNLFFNIHPHLH